MKGYVASHLKDMNRMTVYKLFTQNEEVFRGAIAKETGISAPTVLKIVSFMLENNLVLELGEREGAVGRKPQMLTLNGDAVYTIGIVFEGNFIRAGIMNLKCELLHLATIAATSDFCNDAKKLIPDIISSLIGVTGVDAKKLRGIGIGIPGPYDSGNNTITYAPLVGIHQPENVDWLIDWLTEAYQVQVVINNDVNLGVIGEYHARKLDDDDLIYINVGTGLGAGIILDGKLRVGKNYQCGEIGYMVFPNADEYTVDRKKAGWMEAKINIRALNASFGYEDIVTNQSEATREIIEYIAEYLSLCINNIVSVIDCQNIVVGGMVPEALGEKLIFAINKKLEKISVTKVKVTSAKSVGSGVQGACCEAMDQVITDLLMQ